MATTKTNLDGQTDKVLTEPQVQTRMQLRDASAVQTLFMDWDEPAAADRTINFPDPGADDTIVYLNATQTLTNKTVPAPTNPVDIATKDYVDTEVASVTIPDATSGSGGATKGKLTMDEDKGLLLTGGVAEIKVDGVTAIFNGSGELEAVTSIPDATAGSGGATKGQATADSDKGLDVAAGVLEVKIDGSTVQFNGSGQLEANASGGVTGTVSGQVQVTEDIAAITPPTGGTTGGGDISTLDFLTGAINGTRFAFTVPDDYGSGDLIISVTQQMGGADVAGSVEITTQAKIVDVSLGAIDSATYPEAQATHTVPTTTDVERRDILTITAGDFAVGDTIQMLFKRLGTDVGDVHPSSLQILTFQFDYTSIISGREVTRQAKIFENAPGETPTTPNTISGGDITVEDFPTAADTGLKFDFTVPDNWDEASNAEVRLNYTMSASDAGDVRLETRAKIARVVGGTIDTIAAANFDFTPGAGDSTVPKSTTSVLSIPASGLSKGDAVTVVIVRRGTVGADTHTDDFQLICAIVRFGAGPASSVNVVTIREEYLNQGSFGNASGPGVTGDTDFADLTEFETYDRMVSTVAAGALDVSYEGRLGNLQSEVKEIRFFVKGTGTSPQYTLTVYAEGTGLVHTDGPNAAPVGVTEIVKTDLDLSAQPTGSGRFIVVISTDIDASEAVLVSRPFVRLE